MFYLVVSSLMILSVMLGFGRGVLMCLANLAGGKEETEQKHEGKGDQGKRKKSTLSEYLLCVRPRLDTVNKYQLSESKICIFFILVFPVLHT